MANVLLVDDDGSVLLTLAIALRRYGHTVTVACDGNQALLHLKRHQFAYLVSDVRMPGMSGIELASRARRLAHPPRIILTSAYSNIQLREGIVDAFLQKPIDTERLNAILSTDPDAGMNNGTAHAVENQSQQAETARVEERARPQERRTSPRLGPAFRIQAVPS